MMLTDVEIAQSAKMKPIKEIAEKVGLDEDDLELYGKYKAKISLEAISQLKEKENGKLILVTAINPTPKLGSRIATTDFFPNLFNA